MIVLYSGRVGITCGTNRSTRNMLSQLDTTERSYIIISSCFAQHLVNVLH